MAAITLRNVAELDELRRRLGRPVASVEADLAAARALVMLPQMSEREFTSLAILLAGYCGYRVAHFRPGRVKRGSGWETPIDGNGKGFPDLLCVHEERRHFLVAELKCGNNRPSPEQKAWLRAFAAAGADTFVWYPRDFEAMKTVMGAG
jgi:hypothetical protein